MNGGRVGEVVLHVGGNAVASEGVLRHVHPLGDSPRRCLADGGGGYAIFIKYSLL